MKLHLPVALRKSVLLLCVAASTITSAWGGAMHENISQRVYADFGQNRGRYKVNGVSTMLQAIREKDNLIVIPDNNPDTKDHGISLEQGMIDFTGTVDYGYYQQCYGAGSAFGSNYLVTVAHNPHFDAAFGGYIVGSENTIKYRTISVSEKDLGSPADWALYRQNKIYTDVVGAHNYSGVKSQNEDLNENGILDIKEKVEGTLMYRAGGGDMDYWMSDGSRIDAGSPYTFLIGGVCTIRFVAVTEENIIFADWNMNNQDSGVSEKSPLPVTAGGGDSGTANYIYNQEAGRYEYFFSERATNFTTYNVGHGSIDFANESMAKYSREVNMTETHTAYLNAVSNGSGTITVGDETISHLAVNSGTHTWKDLSAVKDQTNWFAYDNGYMNGINGLGSTHNLLFDGGNADNTIILNATVDTGVGYLEFNNGKFTIKNAEGGNHTLNSAGYVINEGAEVHVQLTNDANYMREWRKNGEGDLYIEGSGDNNILLAVGGSGTTYLNREGGYAAYNVMAASGATVVIKDINQIERDFTFGLNGGTLDMNGNSMDWYTTHADAKAIAADGFSINTLTDSAILTNTSGTTELIYKQNGESTWLGSIKDTATGAIQVVVDAGAGSVWTMNSICTDLTNNAGSSFTVNSGTAVLAGTNTEHGPGSVQYSNDVWSSEHDWHYADAQMDVTVNEGGTFQLGTHARLKGDITVNGGTYVMSEGVRQRMEYIEGGIFMEDTYEWAEYYGHHGDTKLNNGALKVQFHADTTAETTYSGNITGSGTVSVDTGKGRLILTGNNTFTGARSVENGTLIVEDAAAAGSGKWLVKDKGIFASQNADGSTTLTYIDSASTGVLALTQNQTSQINMTGHNTLILGALEGLQIQYGEAGTTEKLATNANGEWRLGGGGGELVVNYHLSGDNKLVLGNGHTQGTVTLTNTSNNFTGGIDFVSSGVTLNYTDPAAVDKIKLNLTYGNRATMAPMINNVTAESNGILLQNQADADIDMSRHASLFLGAEVNFEYNGDITVAEGQDYRFSAANGTFTVNSELGGNHNIVVDAQGYKGGTVKLTNANPITGSVTVMGSNSNSEVTPGNITLGIDQDGMLDNATGVYLKNGGTLHIGDSTQRLGNLVVEEGSVLTGNRMQSADDTRYSTIHITLDSIADIKGKVNIDTIHKYGTGTLELNDDYYKTSNLQYRQLFVEEGDVRVTKDYASFGNVYIRGNTFDINGYKLYQGNINAEDGALIDASKAGSSIGAYVYITAVEGTATLDNGTNDVSLTSGVGATEGATLRLIGTGHWDFNSAGYNTGGGTLRIEDADAVKFTYGTNKNQSYDGAHPHTASVTVRGTLELTEGVDSLQSAAECYVQELNFDTIKLSGQNLSLEESKNQAVWKINNLQASENSTLTWNASRTTESNYNVDTGEEYWGHVSVTNSSRLILKGENSFNGTIVAKRTADGRAYNSYVELAHDKALQYGTLDMQGYSGANMALAVNTDNARIQGLIGNEYTLAYGGESSSINLDTAPTSTRDSILSITGSGTYEYKGAVAGLSIAMEGTGTQKFTGSNVSVADIHANAGHLEFASNTTVTGTIYLGKGGVLNMGERYSLNEGATLAIVGNQGSMEGTLVLNGGALAFDANALNAGTAQFNGTMEFAAGRDAQAIGILDTNALDLGRTYTLFTSNWSGKTATMASSMPDYLTSIFEAGTDGLKMTVTMAGGYAEWQGDYGVFAAENTVIFRDTTATTSLNFTEAKTASALRFINEETYTFSGSDVTLNGALKMDSGKLVLNNKLTTVSYEATGGTLEIAKGGTLALTNTLTSAENRTATVNGLSGTGTLQVKLDKTGNTYDNKLAIDADFTGTTHVLEGNLTLTGSTFGNTLKLANGVNAQINAGTTINGNMELDGTSGIHQNSGNNLTINGTVTGENGTWNRHGGGTLNLNGDVLLSGFDINADNTTNNFNAKATIGTVMIDQNNATMNFKGETSLGTITVGQHNCVVNFDGNAEIGTLNVGRAVDSSGSCRVNINADTEIGTLNIGSGADYKGNSTVIIDGYTTADAVNLQHNNYTLQGSGTLETKHFNYTASGPLSLDGLKIVETTAHNRSRSGNSTSTINLINGAVLDIRHSDYSVDGTLAIGGADADGIMYVNGIQLSPDDLAYNYSSNLNVNKGAHLIIAGEDSNSVSGDFVLAAYGNKHKLMGHKNTIKIDGELTSNAAMTLMHNDAVVNVNNGAILNLLKGITLTGRCIADVFNSDAMYATLNVNEGARINAAGGTQHGNLNVSLAANTTLGAIGEADSTVTFSNNMSWGTAGKDGTITIDTAATTADENLQLVRSEDQGVTVDITGNISLKGNTALEVVGSGTLKHKAAFNNATAIRVQEGATLAVDSTAVAVDSTAALTAGAELNKGGLALDSVTVSGKDITITDSASIRATGGTSTLAANTVLANAAAISYDVAEGATLKSTGTLGGSGRADIAKTGTGTLHLNNAGNAVGNIRVYEGELDMYGAGTYNMNDLMVATSASLSFYAGVIDNKGAVASITVDGTASFTAGSTLNANLTLTTGSTLEVSEGYLSMNGSLTLQQGLTLGDATLQRIQELSLGEGVTLFTGVDSLILEATDYSQLTPDDAVLASDYFSNITSNNYVLTYTGANVGTLAIVMNIPEPTTATLSLLALAGLAARRRRND